MRFVCIFTSLLVITYPCYQEAVSWSSKTLYSGQSKFALDLFLTISLEEKTKTENIFISPFSVYNVLLLAYLFSDGKTKDTMKDALHLPNDMNRKEVAQAYKKTKLVTTKGYELLSADAIFADNNLKIKKEAKKSFKDEIIRANFPSGEIVSAMNSWAAEHTKNEIKEIIDGPLDPEARLALANAAYFKGTWINKFPEDRTRVKDFFVSTTETVPVTMMISNDDPFRYAFTDKTKIVELPYDGEEVSMFGVLPEWGSSLNDILTRPVLEEIFNVIRDTRRFRLKELVVSFPKFEIMYTKKLSQDLAKLGFRELLQRSPNLSKLTDMDFGGLGDVLHYAKVKVDEQGTTAAAVTAGYISLRGKIHVEEVKFDHPFIYVIYNKVQETFLFMGIFKRPPPQ